MKNVLLILICLCVFGSIGSAGAQDYPFVSKELRLLSMKELMSRRFPSEIEYVYYEDGTRTSLEELAPKVNSGELTPKVYVDAASVYKVLVGTKPAFIGHDSLEYEALSDIYARQSEGKPFTRFVNYKNYSGGTTSLDDLKGSYVYIDIWATWCGPCVREIPSLKKVEKMYHDNRNIKFVSISVDYKEDYEKWRRLVKEKAMTGIQLYSNGDQDGFRLIYGVIPWFVLLNPEGNIVSGNAPRPSSPELVELFDKHGI